MITLLNKGYNDVKLISYGLKSLMWSFKNLS